MKFSLIASGPDLVGDELEGLMMRAREPRPVMEQVQAFLLHVETEQFETHGAHGGTPWPDDTDEWVERKRKRGQPADPEEATLQLRDSLTKKRARGGIRRLSKAGTTVGSRLPQAVYARRPPGRNRPRREVNLIRMTASDDDHVVQMVSDWLLDGVLIK